MKKNKIIILTVICLIICCTPFAIYHIPKYIEQRQEEKRIEQEEKQRERDGKNIWYTEYLCMDGDFQVTYDSVTVSNQTIRESDLTANICFYNYFKAEDVNREILLKEYDNFCKDKGQWDNLEAYIEFMYDRDFGLVGDEITKYTLPLDEYKSQLYAYLSVKELDYDTISTEELGEHCDEVLAHIDELYFESMLSAINKDLNYIGEIGYTLDKADINSSEYHGDYRVINKYDECT